ncbi:zinc-dependent alcohol dehydrogenase [Actinopolyspora mortivallis]|uniref:Dehydrogenase n=1 Tax=Actinopolyspora mortivallis TaxID=33906 RepID=A0A2T0GVZ4_ACTMO|nr:alcohol dehydrogenase catalytic domain-containing protein [Actinopolyspora mortivallis]PRW63183.1 dehydrogenase [Actinopolyspora mortivallis]
MSDAPRAVRIEEPGVLRLVPTDPTPPGPGEALVEVAYSGICGSDREVFTGGRPEGFVRYPVVPGHEWSGRVAAVGTGVDEGLFGRLVVGEGFRSCGVCPRCRRGDTNLCAAEYDETGFTSPGAWADWLTLPARLLHVLPDHADPRGAAALEPAACAAAATLKLAPVPGERVAVVGGGSLGLLTTQLIAASSPGELTMVEPNERRAELAESCGASRVCSPERARGELGGYDAVVEAAGVPGTAELATALARPAGRVVLTGVAAQDSVPLDPARLVLSQLTVHTVFGAPSHAWVHAVSSFTSGALDPGVIVTEEFGLEEAERALRSLERNVKTLLRP